eukprot:XP_020407377.1 ent-copalyl diphosphate synthase 2 [Zea mays]
MGFRLLRLHGYHVSPCVFKRFENGDGQFVCYARQSNQSVSAMYNLYRAADQGSFPGDDPVLQRAKSYSRAFLRERRASDQLNDKWIISEGLPSEVGYGLDFPWEACLPRIETRMYLEQYGGSHDVWIGKVLYRMNMVSNDMYLKAAKADFGNFQRLCRLEWHDLKRWCDKISNIETYGVASRGALLRAYFLAAACIFEPSRAAERLAWARAAVLAEAISCCLLSNVDDACACNKTTAEWLVQEFTNGDDIADSYEYSPARRDDDGPNSPAWGASSLAGVLRELVNLQASGNAAVAGCLRGAWIEWLMAWTGKETEKASRAGDTALLLARTVEICSGRRCGTEKDLDLLLRDYSKLQQLTRCICSRLATEAPALNGETMDKIDALDRMVGLEMRELAQCVFRSGGSSVDRETRQTFLHVTKSYYYVALCSPETVEHHISKVLFEDVV